VPRFESATLALAGVVVSGTVGRVDPGHDATLVDTVAIEESQDTTPLVERSTKVPEEKVFAASTMVALITAAEAAPTLSALHARDVRVPLIHQCRFLLDALFTWDDSPG
jgi:hypothetical protein